MRLSPSRLPSAQKHIDRLLAIAQRRERQSGPAEHGQHSQQQHRQPCALQPVAQGLALAVAVGQYQGAMFDACGEVAPLLPRSAVGFQVFQRACLFFAQADGFTEPECVQGSGCAHAFFQATDSP